MPHYFLILDSEWFHNTLRPALTASWRRRSFQPCQALCGELAAAARKFDAYAVALDGSLLTAVQAGLPFDRNIWRCLVGEALLYGAAEVPELQTAMDSLTHLLAIGRTPNPEVPREQLAPIQQAHLGSHDLQFGGIPYRPEHVGFNDRSDVRRLAGYLADVDPSVWTAADLQGVAGLTDAEQREEELEYARQCLPALQQLYERARERQQVIVCEIH